MSSGGYFFRAKRTERPHIQPQEFLELARKNIIRKDKESLPDAISNIKRAIDSQIDILLEIYGLLKRSEREHWPFPRKLKVLERLGLVSPTILLRINKNRVRLEHKFIRPKRRDVIDSLEVAEMFIELFKFRRHGPQLIIDYDRDFALLMDTEVGEILLYHNTKLIYDKGGAHMFRETVKENGIQPVRKVNISDLDGWIDICADYLTGILGFS